jgi:hypothetical protein
MLDSAEDDTNSLIPTSLDIERLNNMEVGQTIENEYGTWKCIRYKKEYVLILHDSKVYNSYSEWDDLCGLIEFLRKT